MRFEPLHKCSPLYKCPSPFAPSPQSLLLHRSAHWTQTCHSFECSTHWHVFNVSSLSQPLRPMLSNSLDFKVYFNYICYVFQCVGSKILRSKIAKIKPNKIRKIVMCWGSLRSMWPSYQGDQSRHAPARRMLPACHRARPPSGVHRPTVISGSL